VRSNLFWLSDEQWKRIEPHLPTDVRGIERANDRRVISGIVHVLKSGCRWCDCPPEYGPPTTIYNRFVRWARRGIWENLFRELARNGRSTDTQMIDSTHVKAHRSAAGGNVWPAPSASGFLHWPKQSAQTYPAFRLRRWPRWRSARSGPHKGDGIEVPFSAVGLQNADRLSGHLFSTTRRHH
jgi:transposase